MLQQVIVAAQNTAPWVGACGILMIAAVAIFTTLTPYPEFKLIREGNVGAAASVAGMLIGFSLVLKSVIVQTHQIFPDLLVWAGFALVAQLVAFFVVNLFMHNMQKKMATENNTAAGVFLGSVSLAVGILISGILAA